jgi:hypothetical protein
MDHSPVELKGPGNLRLAAEDLHKVLSAVHGCKSIMSN